MKRGKKMLLLLAALCVLVGAYYLTKALTKEPEVADTEGSYEIAAVTTDTLTEMSWKNGDDTITLKKTDAGWAYAPDETFPLNQDKAGEMADSLAALKGTNRDPGWMMKVPLVILCAVIVVLGVYSKPLVTFLRGVASGLIF